VDLDRRRPADEPISVVQHDADWARQGNEAVAEVRDALGDLTRQVEHIGSTAVPGLAAKPVLDIAAAVDVARHEEAAARLSARGFEDLGAAAPGRGYLRRRKPRPAVNVQLMTWRGPLWSDNLLIREYLRANPDAAAMYARSKRAAAARHPTLLAYSAAKAAAVERLRAEARADAAAKVSR
jgi:GrpB-like predicted nucleotidyltransferase (UPF0157 family)